MAIRQSDMTEMADQRRKGLEAIVKSKLNDGLEEVRRRYTVEAAVDARVVVGRGENVALDLLMNHARDELVMRVRTDVDLLLHPEAARAAADLDRAAAEVAKAKAESAREEARIAELRYKERHAEAEAKRLSSEQHIQQQVDYQWRKKEGELSRKITWCDKTVAEAATAAQARVKAEAGVALLVGRWLRSFTTLALDDASKRAALLELD